MQKKGIVCRETYANQLHHMHMYCCRDYRGKTNFPDYQEIQGFSYFGFNFTKQFGLKDTSYSIICYVVGNVIWINIPF